MREKIVKKLLLENGCTNIISLVFNIEFKGDEQFFYFDKREMRNEQLDELYILSLHILNLFSEIRLCKSSKIRIDLM